MFLKMISTQERRRVLKRAFVICVKAIATVHLTPKSDHAACSQRRKVRFWLVAAVGIGTRQTTEDVNLKKKKTISETTGRVT